jgi:hypothetical protein
MTQSEINDAISLAFGNLAELNSMLYDFWISELYDEDGDLVEGMWSEETVREMEKDVMMQQQAVATF